MTLPLGQKLQIRAMIYLAGEPIPYSGPCGRSFTTIHSTGWSTAVFEAVEEGGRMFHPKGFLKRADYQR